MQNDKTAFRKRGRLTLGRESPGERKKLEKGCGGMVRKDLSVDGQFEKGL